MLQLKLLALANNFSCFYVEGERVATQSCKISSFDCLAGRSNVIFVLHLKGIIFEDRLLKK